MKTLPFYIVTKDGYFFESQVELDIEYLKEGGCQILETKEEMYKAAMEVSGLDDIEEVDGAEMIVREENVFAMMGILEYEDMTKEDFIITFRM